MKKLNLETIDFTRSLLFTWPTGVWKTYQAKQLLNKFVEQSDDPKYILNTYTISDWHFKQMVKSNMLVLRWPTERQSSITAYPLEVMLRARLLLYDDLWVSDVSDAYIRDLTFILDTRIEKNLPTIYTTNLSKDELTSKLNERIVSRLLYNTDVVIFGWEDRRLSTTNYYTI